MCSLCGLFGEPGHWADDDADAGLRERMVALILAGQELSLRPWTGGGYVVARRGGGSAFAESLATVWAVAERMAGKPFDPLDPAIIGMLADGPAE